MPFLTGDDTAATVDISLTLPDDEHLLAAVLGQLTFLTYASNWEQHGTATPADRADEMRTAIANLMHAPGGDLLVPLDRKPDYFFTEEYALGVATGTFNSGAWRVRNINTIAINRGGLATLVGSTMAVPTGAYWVYCFGSTFRVGDNALRLADADLGFEIGTPWTPVSRAHSSSGHSDAVAQMWAETNFGAGGDFKLEHRCQTSRAGSGMGLANPWHILTAAGVMLWSTD